MALKKLTVEVGMNTAQFQRGLKGMQVGLNGMQSGMKAMQGRTAALSSGLQSMGNTGTKAMSAIGSGAVLTTAKIAALVVVIKKAVDGLLALQRAYATLESNVLRVNDLFGDSAKYIQYFAENTAKSLGMSESAAYEYAATYGNLFRNITTDAQENAKVTIAMLKASAVIASKTGRTMEDVMERIRSGLLGNTEAIEDLGIQVNVSMLEMTDAFKKIANGRTWEQLTFYEQQQIRTLGILEQAHRNFGDSVQQSSAFTMQTLSSAFKDLTATAGAFVNAGLQPIIQGLTQLVQWATMGLKALAALFGLQLDIGGASTSSTKAQTAAQDDLTDAVEKTAKAQQKLAGFDEINTLPKSVSGGGAAVGAGSSVFAGLPDPEFKISEPDMSWLDKVKQKLGALKDLFAPVIDAVKNAWSMISVQLQKISKTFEETWEGIKARSAPFVSWFKDGFIPFLATTIGATGHVIAGLLDSFDITFKSIRDTVLHPFIETLGTEILPTLTSLAGQIVTTLVTVFDTIKIRYDALVKDVVTPLMSEWSAIWQDTWTIISDTWDEYGEGTFQKIREAIWNVSDIWNIAWSSIKPVIDNLAQNIDWLWSEHLQPLVANIGEFVAKLTNLALDIYNNFISPIISWFVTLFGPQISNTIQFLGDVFTTVFAIISDVLNTWVSVLTGIIDFVSGVFSGDWEKAWQGVQDIFKAMFDGMVNIGKGVLNIIIDLINGVTGGISSIAQGLSNIPGMEWAASISIPKISKLARGGIIEQPTLAMVGEAGTEAVMPLENNTGWIDVLANKIVSSMGGAQVAGAGNITVPVYIGNELIEEVVVNASNNHSRKNNGRR